MKFLLSSLLGAFAAFNAVNAAAPRSYQNAFSASHIKSLSLRAWGPLEKDSAGDAILLDPTTTSASDIADLKSRGKAVICYMSAGTLENYRKDVSDFSKDSRAKKYKGFGGTETWLDITKWEELKGPMGDRVSNAASKGCMGMEMDNMDCWLNMCVPGASYQELKTKQIEYVKWLIGEIHDKGMAAGLKNAIGLFDEVADMADFAINEECQTWSECSAYKRFTSSDRVVFNVEYSSHDGHVCQNAQEHDMVTLYKDGGSWKDCWN